MQTGAVLPSHPAEDGGLVGVLEEEVHGPVDGERHGAVDLDLVEDVGAARAAQAPALHPGRGQETGGVGAGGEDARVGGDDLAALGDGEPEGEEVVGVGGSAAQLGQDGEIDVVQGRARLGQVLEGDAAGVALELGDERRVGPAGGGTQAHVDAGLGSLARHAVGAARAQRHVDDEHGPAVERDEVDGGDELGGDAVIDEAGDALRLGERVGHARHTAVVVDADDQAPSRGVGEGDDGAQRLGR